MDGSGNEWKTLLLLQKHTITLMPERIIQVTFQPPPQDLNLNENRITLHHQIDVGTNLSARFSENRLGSPFSGSWEPRYDKKHLVKDSPETMEVELNGDAVESGLKQLGKDWPPFLLDILLSILVLSQAEKDFPQDGRVSLDEQNTHTTPNANSQQTIHPGNPRKLNSSAYYRPKYTNKMSGRPITSNLATFGGRGLFLRWSSAPWDEGQRYWWKVNGNNIDPSGRKFTFWVEEMGV